MIDDPVFQAVLLAKLMGRRTAATGGNMSDPNAFYNDLMQSGPLGVTDAALQKIVNINDVGSGLPIGVTSSAKPTPMGSPGTPDLGHPDISGQIAPAGPTSPSVVGQIAGPAPAANVPVAAGEDVGAAAPVGKAPATKSNDTTQHWQGGVVGYADGGTIENYTHSVSSDYGFTLPEAEEILWQLKRGRP